MFSFLNPYSAALKIGLAIALAVALGAAVLAYNSHERGIGRAEILAAWDHANKVAFEARDKRIAAAHKAEADLQSSANEDRRNNAKAEDELRARVTALTGELRERPSRPVATAGRTDLHQQPPGPGPQAGCTGAALYRDDANFLVGFAADSERITAQRDACYVQYGRAQAALKAQGQGR